MKAFSYSRLRLPGACALVALVTALVFCPALGFDYVNFDDPAYVTGNALVKQGITWPGIKAALVEPDLHLYTPLTRLSHMLDCQLFGIAPAGHHAVNIALHMTASVLLLLILARCTGQLGTSVVCALLFAVHPLRAESVAWITERKDVLSMALGMGAILAYVHYATGSRGRRLLYGLCLALLGLSMLAKPMFVTLPAILLIVDFWPLGRLGSRGLRACFIEKAPIAAVAGAALVLVMWVSAHVKQDGVAVLEDPPLAWRLGNACINPMVYLGQIFCPVSLGPFYWFGNDAPPLWQVVCCAFGVAALTGSALAVRKTAPYVTAGWAWYLVALAPMLHIQPMGMDRHADRYTYLPGIGIAMALCWGVRAWASRPRAGRAAARIERWAVPALSAAGVLAMASLAWDQELIWRDSPTLWSATLENCGPSALAENGLASSLQAAGRSREALEPAIAAVKMGPWLPYAHLNLANCLMSLHRPRLAIREYMLQLQQAPDNAEAHANLGAALLSVGRAREGIAETEIGLRLDPTQEVARRNLARCTGGAVPPGS